MSKSEYRRGNFKQITFRVNPEEWDKLFFNSRGYSTLTNYIRKKLFEQDDLYELMCKSCDNCSFFKAGRNKCVNLPICLNAVEIHADDSERKLNQRLNYGLKVQRSLKTLRGE